MTDPADDYARSMLTRSGLDRLPAHLQASYGIEVAGTAELDLGVFRIDRSDGPPWVARVFPAARRPGAAAGDATVLDFLAGHGFPAERAAAPDPVSVLDRQDVLVTGYVEGVPRSGRTEAIRRLGGFVRLGAMLARLETLPGARETITRDGGAWHHLADGSPGAEIAAAAALLAAAEGRVAAGHERAAYESLRADVAGFDGGDDLPEALVHPDFVLANAIPAPASDSGSDGAAGSGAAGRANRAAAGRPAAERPAADRLVMVDWTGAGIGPRLWPLAFLLYAAGARGPERVGSVVRGYTRYARLEPGELSRLAAVMTVRPSIFEIWAFGAGRKSAAEAAHGVARARELAGSIAARAVEAFRDAA